MAIGQKKAGVARTVATLEEFGAMEHTIVVSASADEPSALQYIAPYAGCAIGEEFMEAGRDALIIYDDLSKHAWSYRELSLLLRRPPGREAYPGDLFYLHSRLLERAARLADHFVIVPEDYSELLADEKVALNGKTYIGPLAYSDAEKDLKELGKGKILKVRGSGGSLTALPIIETLLGDVSAYVPTNVISITDGQIYLENDLFYSGIRPAINAGISVSRVGGDAQLKAMRTSCRTASPWIWLPSVSWRLLPSSDRILTKLPRRAWIEAGGSGKCLSSPQFSPVPIANQIVVIYAATNGYADEVNLTDMIDWEDALVRYVESSHPDLLKAILDAKQITPDIEEQLKTALDDFSF